MKDKLLKGLKKYWITLWLVVILLSVFILGGITAYTSITSVKKVVSTKGGAGVLFSSNYMQPTDTPSPRTVSISAETTNPSVDVTVCNYSQDDPTTYNDSNIQYNFTAELITYVNGEEQNLTASDFDGSSNYGSMNSYYLKFGEEQKYFDENDGKLTVEFTDKLLTKNKKSVDTYSIFFDTQQLTKWGEISQVYVKLTAKPTVKTGGISDISAIIGVAPKTEQIVGWNGKFTDDSSVSAEKYDGFNYQIYGSGKGTVTLSWDESRLEISPWFLSSITYEEITANSEDSESKVRTIKFEVNSQDISQYDVQFYRAVKASDVETWDYINFLVKLEFEEQDN